MSINLEHRFDIYCDEASTDVARYMLIGGIWVPHTEIDAVRASIAAYRAGKNLTREMKWKKVSNKMISAYQGYVDLFFDNPPLSFNCIAIDTHQVNYKKYHGGDKELGFYKFYNLLISRRLKPDCVYWLYTDERNNRKANRLTDLKDSINSYCIKQFSCAPLRHVEPRDSHKEDFIQIADILLGALAYERNGYNSSPAKMAVAAHIASRLGWANLTLDTPKDAPKFNVWAWRSKNPSSP